MLHFKISIWNPFLLYTCKEFRGGVSCRSAGKVYGEYSLTSTKAEHAKLRPPIAKCFQS